MKNNEENHPKNRRQSDWLGRKRSTLMIVASLLATVAFQAGLSPPGGVWQADSAADHSGRPYQAGQSIMAYNIPRGYGQFVIFNTISFLASLSIILIQISGLPLRKRRWMWTQMVIMSIAISAQTITYLITLIHMSPKRVEGTLSQVTRISVLVWLCLMGTIFIGNVARIVRHMLRKYGYIVDRKEEPLNNEEDDDA